MFTPIHRALGIQPGTLDITLIEQAVENHLPEQEDLDWKRDFYNPHKPTWQDEAAKDIAAMANSGGGWIVFGVDEQDSTASALSPITWDDSSEQRLRQVAYARIGPPVTALEIHVVPAEGGSIVAVRVPNSPDIPHFASKGQDAFVAARRNGPHTVFMGDREIEQAFQRRFRTIEDRERSLAALYEEAALPMNPTAGVALVVAAQPSEPPRATVTQAPTDVFPNTHPEMFMANTSWGDLAPIGWTWCHGQVRRGLRRWTNQGRTTPEDYAKSILDDGTVLAAYRLGGTQTDPEQARCYPVGQPNDCMSYEMERALLDAVALTRTWAARVEVPGIYRFRAGLIGDPSQPIYIRTTQGSSNFILDRNYVLPIHRFHPVTFDLYPLAEKDRVIAGIRDAALDLINQGGVTHLKAIVE